MRVTSKDRYYDVVEGDAKYYNQAPLPAAWARRYNSRYNSRRFPMTLGIDAHPFYKHHQSGPEWIRGLRREPAL